MAKGCWLLVLALMGVLLAAFFSTPRTLPSPLLQAAYKGELDVVQRMLPLAKGNGRGGTPAANHDAAFVAHVREQANAKDAWNNTALHWAVKGGHARSVEIAKHLLSAGVDARTTNNGGSTALHWAATGPVADISRALIALLLDQPDVYVNAANNAGETPLHWAVDWLRPHAVQALLSAGADVSKVDRDGNSPLHKIKADCDESEDCTEIVRLLVAAGSDISLANAFKRTPLQYFNQDKEGQRAQRQQQQQQQRQPSQPPPPPSPAEQPSEEGSVRRPPPPPPGSLSLSSAQIDELQEQIEEFRQNLTESGMLPPPQPLRPEDQP